MMKSSLYHGIVTVVIPMVLAILGGRLQAQTLVVPTGYDARSPHTINIQVLANNLNYATSGRLTLDVHPGGELFAAGAIYDAVREGRADMGEVLLASLADRNPVFLVDNLPFLATDFESAQVLWQASRDTIEKHLRADGLTLLYATPWAPQGLYTNDRIEDVRDLAGLRVRSYSATLDSLLTLTGSRPVNVDYAALRSAFEGGRVDAMITSPTTGVRAGAWLFATTYTDIRALIPKNIVFINTARFESLPASQQTQLKDQAQEAEQRGWTIARQDYFRSRITLSDNGMTVRRPSQHLQHQLHRLGQTMLDDWLSRTGSEGEAILAQYRALTVP